MVDCIFVYAFLEYKKLREEFQKRVFIKFPLVDNNNLTLKKQLYNNVDIR